MGGLACCCGIDPCTCTASCTPYLPDPTWTISVLGKTVVMTRIKCQYHGYLCWEDAATEVNSWTEDPCVWMDDPGVGTVCPVYCCVNSGLSHQTIEYQIAVKVAQKRWRRVIHRIDATVYPVNDAGDRVNNETCTTKLKLQIDYSKIVIYYYSWSAYGWVRWRKRTTTCGAYGVVTETVGSWNNDAEPTLPTVEKPHKFAWCLYDPNFSNNGSGHCVAGDLIEGPAITCLSDWPTHVVTTLNQLYCNGYGVCSQHTVDGIVPVDLTEQKCDLWDSLIIFLTNCYGLACPFHCDESLSGQSYRWVSSIFDCTAIPYGSISLTNTAATPPSGTTSRSCGSQTFTYVYPAVESSTISVTI